MQDRKAVHVVRILLEHVIAQYACPEILVSDNAPEFVGSAVKDLCTVFGIRHKPTPSYTPSLNAPVERFHFWLNAMLTILVSRRKDNWDSVLPLVLLSYRTTPVNGIGLSPYQMLYKCDPRQPMSLASAWTTPHVLDDDDVCEIQDVARTIHDVVARARSRYVSRCREDRLRAKPKTEPQFAIGDFCLIYRPKVERTPNMVSDKPKLKDRWSLPCLVIAKDRHNVYIVRDAMGQLHEVRPDCMVAYRFYYDGKPSIPSRTGYTRAERARLNKDPSAYIPPIACLEDLVVFPMSLGDKPAFGVGMLKSINCKGEMDIHWWGNPSDDLTGTYDPIWMPPSKLWYCSPTQRSLADTPVMTSAYYGGTIAQGDLADVGFKLDDKRLPRAVLEHVHNSPAYAWTMDDEQ